MSKILLSIVAASALAGAAIPAAAMAEPYRDRHGGYDDRYDHGRGGGINARQAELSSRIERGIRTGRLTGREAMSLRAQSRDIARLEARYRIGGLNRFERNDLENRLDRLAFRVASEMRDGDRYGYGYGPGRGW